MKHDEILCQLVAEAENDPNLVGLLVFGSVAKRTHNEDSDIDIITILKKNEPTSGIVNTHIDGIKIGNVFFTRDVLEHSAKTVPYLLHPLAEARLLYDYDNTLQPLFDELRVFFIDHPEIAGEWNGHYERFRKEKAQFGYEKTNIVEVWNEFESRHSGGRIKRRFFTSLNRTDFPGGSIS